MNRVEGRAIGINQFRHLGLNVLFRTQNSSPGSSSPGAVLHRANDFGSQFVEVALSFCLVEDGNSRAGCFEIVSVGETGDSSDAPIG